MALPSENRARWKSFSAWLFTILPLACLSAQEPFVIPRLSAPIVFDGQVDDSAWLAIAPLPLWQLVPDNGAAPTEPTEIRVAYDDNYLYVSGAMWVSSPDHITRNSRKRDGFTASNDWLAIVIDSYYDRENALWIMTSPTGQRADAAVANDAQGEMDVFLNIDWNTFWDTRTTVTDAGWFAEMRIPFSSLRFQDQNGKVTMGIMAWRWKANPYEVDVFPKVSNQWGFWSFCKPSQCQLAQLDNVDNRNPVYLTPYLLSGYQETSNLNDSETAWDLTKTPKLEAGFDLKYNLTSNLVLDATANTDFAQVEADNQQVNLTRFSLFFPEKRQFFQERSSIFDFRFDDFNRLFYSRRIGLQDGDPVRIYGGVRLTGRLSGHDIGFLNMQTAASNDLNSENFTLLRVRKRAFNDQSYLGAVLSNRTDFQGNFNTGFGLDGLIRVAGDDYLTIRMAQTHHSNGDNRLLSMEPTRLYLNWEKRRFEGFNYNIGFSRAGVDYDPAMGFELRQNYSSLSARVAHGWILEEGKKLLSWSPDLYGQVIQDNADHRIESAYARAGISFSTRQSANLNIALKWSYDDVAEAFNIGDVEVPVNDYRFGGLELYYETPQVKKIVGNCFMDAGSYYGGNLLTINAGPTWTPNSSLELGCFYQYSWITFPNATQPFQAHLARINALYMFSTKLSVAAFVQFNSVDEIDAINLRIRFNPREGNDLFIVFNDIVNNHRFRLEPAYPLHDNRAIVMKYIYTFIL